jgi:LAO/AO transport system kinase
MIEQLSTSPNAFIRPSPTRGILGGVSAYTFDVLSLTEAAGYDITLIETVGVGQSETVVGDIADVLCLVVPPGGGDQLQGIKKGIVEVADLVAVNKADGPFLHAARNTAKDYRDALHLLRPRSDDWTPEVLLVSAIENKSIDQLWEKLEEFQNVMNKKGVIESRRRHRRSEWLWSQLKEELVTCVIQEQPMVQALLEKLRAKVILGEMTPRAAAEEIVHQMLKK